MKPLIQLSDLDKLLLDFDEYNSR